MPPIVMFVQLNSRVRLLVHSLQCNLWSANRMSLDLHHYVRQYCQEQRIKCVYHWVDPQFVRVSVHTGLEQQPYRPRNPRRSHSVPLPMLWMEFLARWFAHFQQLGKAWLPLLADIKTSLSCSHCHLLVKRKSGEHELCTGKNMLIF